MFPDRTEVCPVPRFAVEKDRAGAGATSQPGVVRLHDVDDDVLLSARSPTLLNTRFHSVSLSQLQAARQFIDFQYRFGGPASIVQYTISDNDIQYCSNIPIIQCYNI